jgi:hypothetical protein
MTACSDGVDLCSYAAFRGATRDGEVERERSGAWRRGELVDPQFRVPPPPGASLYRGKGAHLSPTKATLGRPRGGKGWPRGA